MHVTPNPPSEHGCRCHRGIPLDLPAIAKRLEEPGVWALTFANNGTVTFLTQSAEVIAHEICAWIGYVLTSCGGDVEFAMIAAGLERDLHQGNIQ